MIAMEIGTTTNPTKKGGKNARQAKSQVTARTMDVRISIISENILTTKFTIKTTVMASKSLLTKIL